MVPVILWWRWKPTKGDFPFVVQPADTAAPGENKMAGGKVIACPVMQRSDDRKLIRTFGLPRKQFGDFDPFDVRSNGIPDPATFLPGASGFMS